MGTANAMLKGYPVMDYHVIQGEKYIPSRIRTLETGDMSVGLIGKWAWLSISPFHHASSVRRRIIC